MIYPVILSGGSGTRLWPMSRSLYPKQLLALFGDTSLLQQTVQRVAGQAGFAPPLIVANEEHRFIIAEQLRDPEGFVLVMPSDHAIADPQAFHEAVGRAAAAAKAGLLVTFGITPDRAETGYGYIAAGKPIAACDGAFSVARFVEKPQQPDAERYVAAGDYFWNSGIFLFPAAVYLAELERLRPDMLAACKEALAKAKSDADFIRLDKAAFAACPADSIDYAVMEHTTHAAIVPVGMGWSDLGSWDALWEMSAKDERGNALAGNVVAEDTANCYLRSENGLIAAIGVEDLVVVATDDAVMVAPRNRTQEVKTLVGRLLKEGHDQADALSTVHRPWGTYRSIHNGDRVQVKHITVKPGAKLSLQMHHHRAEHWVVVQGTAKIVRGNEELVLTEDQSTYIPLGTAHRLENPGKIPLHVIEVQSGSYLGEDDIVRLEDHYGRD
jgi:mannose-1-phosphate guanylyltransferase/mannose-6-phosphate isomerase